MHIDLLLNSSKRCGTSSQNRTAQKQFKRKKWQSIDRNKKIEFRKVDLDDIDIYNELTQIDEDLFLEDDPDWWTEQELEAIYNNDLELLEKLIKERCPLNGEDN